MGWLQVLERQKGSIRGAYAPWDDFWFDRILTPTASGVDVSHENALGLTAMWCGILAIANALAMVPCRLYRRKANGGSAVADEDRRHRIVYRRPNPWQTSFGWRQMSIGHLLLRGNSYHQKVLRGDGSLDSLTPLHPTRTQLEVEGGRIQYRYRRDDGTDRIFRADEVLHFKGLSTNGLVGYCPVTVHRESLGTAIATDRYAGRFFKNNTMPPGIIKAPTPIDNKSFDRIKAEWKATHGGEGQQSVAFMDSGMEFQSVGFSAEDAQLLDSRTFSCLEAARILNMPPHKLKEMTHATFSNIEHQGIEWVVDTIQPWAENLEQQMDADLLSEREQSTLYFKFELKALLRGDSAQRAAYMQARFNMGSLSPNEIRGLEDEDPIDGGDRYFVQQNLMPMDLMDDILTAKMAPPAPPAAIPAPAEPTAPKLVAFTPLLRDYAARILHQQITATKKAAKKNDWVAFRAWVDEYFGEAAGLTAQQLVPLVTSMAQAAGLDHLQDSEAIRECAVSAATAIVQESVRGILDTLKDAPADELEAAIDGLLESWRWSRPDAISEREVARAVNTFTIKQLGAAV